MNAFPAPREYPPADMAGAQNGVLAPGIPLIPSHNERGFSYQDALSPDPRRLVRGLGRAASLVREFAFSQVNGISGPGPEAVIIPEAGHNYLFLVSEPDPETDVKPSEARNI